MSDPFEPIDGAGKPKKTAAAQSEWQAIMPVPKGAPALPPTNSKLGKPSAIWEYRNSSGNVLGFVCRFETQNGKEFRPLVLFSKHGRAAEWRWESWPAPRPLYGLDRLAKAPNACVILCEGEKSADAATKLLPDCVAVTSPNGSKSANKADWEALRGRNVTIWPDADDAGLAYAQETAKLCGSAGAISISVIVLPSDVEKGWDAADALAGKWTQADALKLVNSAEPFEIVKPKPDKPAKNSAKEERLRQRPARDSLMALTNGCRLWRAPDDDAYVSIPVNNHFENWPIGSKRFRGWLAYRSFGETGSIAGNQAVEDTLRILEARALNEGENHTPWRRVGQRDGKIYLDLADHVWRAIEITRNGWSIIEGDGLPFIRSKRMRPLFDPIRGYSIDAFRRFVNVASEDDFILLVAWILAAMRPRGPYPILVLNGEQGSGKSELSKRLRSLIDPTSPAIQGPPRDEQSLIVGAQNGHLLALDNISFITPEISDGLARLSTGSGFATRALHTDKDENIFEGARPMLINGIPHLSERADLAERTIMIRLQTISENKRKSVEEIEKEWAEAYPKILGALCDALCAALDCFDRVKLDSSSRMADFENWITAAEFGLGWGAGRFAAAYSRNRKDASDSAFESDAVAVAVDAFAKLQSGEPWEGTASDLLARLEGVATERMKAIKSWPRTAQALGNAIDRAKPLLRRRGIAIDKKHSGTRTIIISNIAAP